MISDVLVTGYYIFFSPFLFKVSNNKKIKYLSVFPSPK